MEITGLFGAINPKISSSADDIAGLTDNFDDFLTLLTTQLQHQDPLEPLDSNEFVAQLTQFTEVEQTIKSNTNLETLLALQSANQGVSSLGFIGRSVEAVGTQLPLVGGKANFTYTLPASASSTTVAVLDETGSVVFSAQGETGTGKHQFAWDGTSSSGAQLPDGLYSIAVAASNGDGQQIETSTTVFGLVDGVEASEAGLVLSMGAVRLPASQVISVREAVIEGNNG